MQTCGGRVFVYQSVRAAHPSAVILYHDDRRVRYKSLQQIEYGDRHAERVDRRHEYDARKLASVSVVGRYIPHATAQSPLQSFGDVQAVAGGTEIKNARVFHTIIV